MKKIYMILLLAAASHQCTTANNEADYDIRPTNQAPQLERPAWPNYDVHNENSFAVFNTVLSVPEPQGTHFNGGSWTLYRCKDATYVTYDWTVPSYQDWWFFRFTTGSAIIDADTGDQYMLRELEYFPMDQCFWIHGQSGETIRMVLVFAPLPPSVKYVRFYEAEAPSRKWMDGSAELSPIYSVKKLRPQTSDKEHIGKKGEVIYKGKVIY